MKISLRNHSCTCSHHVNGLLLIRCLVPSVKWCVTRVMIRSLCEVSAWRSRGSCLIWTLIGSILNQRKGGKEERYRILSCAVRDYGKSSKKIVTIYILSAVDVPYYYGFCNGVQFATLVLIFAKLVIERCCDSETWSAACFPLAFFLFFFNYDSCPHTRLTAPRRFMNSPGMYFHLAHRGCHRITPIVDRVRFDIEVLHYVS